MFDTIVRDLFIPFHPTYCKCQYYFLKQTSTMAMRVKNRTIVVYKAAFILDKEFINAKYI